MSSDSESIEITFRSFVFPLVSVNFSSAPHTCWLLGFLVWMGIYTYMFVQYTPLPHSSPARMERGFASSHQNWITQHPNEDDYLTLSYMPLWEVHHRPCFQTWSCWVAIDLFYIHIYTIIKFIHLPLSTGSGSTSWRAAKWADLLQFQRQETERFPCLSDGQGRRVKSVKNCVDLWTWQYNYKFNINRPCCPCFMGIQECCHGG